MFSGLNANLQEMISILSFDLYSKHFSYSFASVYGAELLFSSNNKSSFVTWQMLFVAYTYFGKHGELSSIVSSTPHIRSLVTKFSKMVVFSSSDSSKLFSVSLVF